MLTRNEKPGLTNMTSRYGRVIRAPNRYTDMPSDDDTDEDESVELASSYTDSTDGSLDNFIVDEDVDDESEEDDVAFENFIRHLLDGCSQEQQAAYLVSIRDGSAATATTKGILSHVILSGTAAREAGTPQCT